MTIEEVHAILAAEFGDDALVALHTAAIDPWIEVSASSLVEVCQFLRDDQRLRFEHLNDLCGADYLEPDPKKAKKFGHEEHVEVVYQLSSFSLNHRLKLKVKLPRWQDDVEGQLPELPSVSGVWAIADWHEREAYDLVGIRFLNHGNLRRILCPEDWVGHGLRKDYEFPLEYHGVRGK